MFFCQQINTLIFFERYWDLIVITKRFNKNDSLDKYVTKIGNADLKPFVVLLRKKQDQEYMGSG